MKDGMEAIYENNLSIIQSIDQFPHWSDGSDNAKRKQPINCTTPHSEWPPKAVML